VRRQGPRQLFYSGDRIEFVNSVGNRSIFKDGRIEFVNSVRNSSFEDIGNPGRYYFVNSPTVRRRGVLEFEQFVSDPAPNV